MTTIGESISRVRGIIKALQEDAFVTDRFIYSIIIKYAKTLMKRQQNEHKLMGHDDLFETLSFVELKDVDTVEAGCVGISTNCVIKRTVEKLPKLFSGSRGPLIRKVYTLDSSQEFQMTNPSSFIHLSNSTNFKYNKTKYYWFKNGYLYFPNMDYEAVSVEGLWEDKLDWLCMVDEQECTPMQDRILPLPDYLFSEAEQMAEAEFGYTLRVPDGGADNSQNILR